MMVNFIIAIVLTGVSTILRAFTLSTLWNWFVAPTFNVPALGMAVALGIAVLLSYTLYDHRITRTGCEDAISIAATAIGISTGALLIGYIISLFM